MGTTDLKGSKGEMAAMVIPVETDTTEFAVATDFGVNEVNPDLEDKMGCQVRNDRKYRVFPSRD